MKTIKKYNIGGKEVGEVEVEEAFTNAEANGQMIKDYITAIRANARRWTASTKTRAEVAHTTKKPHPQKGTGRARQGMLSTPQYRGGGRVFGPKPKFDQHISINKKEKKAAIRFLIAEKIREDKIHIIDHPKMDHPSTKKLAHFCQAVNLNKRSLFLGESTFSKIEGAEHEKIKVPVKSTKHTNFEKSLRNLPKVEFMLAPNISGYDVAIANDIVMTEAAFKEITQWLS